MSHSHQRTISDNPNDSKEEKVPSVENTLDGIQNYYDNMLKPALLKKFSSKDTPAALEKNIKMSYERALSSTFAAFLNEVPKSYPDRKYKGYTRLMRAIAENDTSLVDYLIENKADIVLAGNNPDSLSLGNATPLYLAAEAGNLKLVVKLLELINTKYLSDSKYRQYINPPLMQVGSGTTALEAAVKSNHQDVAIKLFEASAAANIDANDTGAHLFRDNLFDRVLSQAIKMKMPKLVDCLLKQERLKDVSPLYYVDFFNLALTDKDPDLEIVANILNRAPIAPKVERLMDAAINGQIKLLDVLIRKQKYYFPKDLEKICLAVSENKDISDRAILNRFLPGLIENAISEKKAQSWFFKTASDNKNKAAEALKATWNQDTYSIENLNKIAKDYPVVKKGSLNVVFKIMEKAVGKEKGAEFIFPENPAELKRSDIDGGVRPASG